MMVPPCKAYFQSPKKEFFADVVNVNVDGQGGFNISFVDEKGETGIVSLAEYKVTEIVPLNEQHFRERLKKFQQPDINDE